MKQARLEQLTWLRGIAAFLVIVSHSIRATEVRYSNADEPSYFLPLGLLDLGSYAVALFFVLSGCTLWISNGTMSKPHEILHYYVKRTLRIWPAFIASLFIYLGFTWIFKSLYSAPTVAPVTQFLHDYTTQDVLRYALLTFNITGPHGLFNGAYWSLPVEFQYYLILPLLAILTRRISIAAPIAASVAMYLVYSYEIIDLARYEVFNLAFTFCGGVLLGYLYERYHTFRINKHFGIIMLLGCLLAASSIYNNFLPLPVNSPWFNIKWNWYGLIGILTVGIALFTDFGAEQSRIGALLSKYGEISYSTYLFHNLFIGISILLIVNLELWGDSMKLFFTFSFTTICTYFFATATYQWIERPGIVLSKHLFRSFRC